MTCCFRPGKKHSRNGLLWQWLGCILEFCYQRDNFWSI